MAGLKLSSSSGGWPKPRNSNNTTYTTKAGSLNIHGIDIAQLRQDKSWTEKSAEKSATLALATTL